MLPSSIIYHLMSHYHFFNSIYLNILPKIKLKPKKLKLIFVSHLKVLFLIIEGIISILLINLLVSLFIFEYSHFIIYIQTTLSYC